MSKPAELTQLIEGVLFGATGPLTVDDIINYFPEEEQPDSKAVRESLAELKAQYAVRGIHLVEVATGFRFQVAPEVVPMIAKSMTEKPARYSRALLETLALIAYRQPITRGEIEDIRGVVVSTQIIKTLDEQGWIRIVGHKEVPGKPALYATTKYFLEHFGLKSLEELPPLAELKDFDSIGFAEIPQGSEPGPELELESESEENTPALIPEQNSEIIDSSESSKSSEVESADAVT